MFNNIIYIIIVLVIFQLNYPVEGLFKSPITAILILFLLWLNFTIYCNYRFSRLLDIHRRGYAGLGQTQVSSAYQSLVTKLSVLSVLMFALSVYLLNLKYWLLKIPGFTTFSILPGGVAILIFFVFLSTIWYYGYPAYCAFFSCPIKRWAYLESQIKLNLPILFPWAILTVCYDVISLLAWPSLKKIFESQIGQFAFFTLFLIVLVLFLPPFIKYWWGCSPLPQTEKKRSMVNFLKDASFKYRDILIWPILEGRMMTAGVMGLLPRFRYILVTDSLLNTLSEEELKAVMAHEMGHIKHRHLLFYVFFLLGYMAISFGLFDVFFYVMATQPGLLGLLGSEKELQAGIFYWLLSLPIILSIILYFRYIMGFFMRNFERQADLYSVRLIGKAEPIITSLEKIARVSGQSRHHPSWHHFSIAERVEFLWRSWQDPRLIKRHSRRLALSLTIFFVLIASLGYTLNFAPIKTRFEHRVLTNILNQRLVKSPDNIEIYRFFADIYHRRENLAKAQWAYENIIRLNPDDALALNNLAWTLATARDTTSLDYPRALKLAQRAVEIKRSPIFLDTLAEAYYVNGLYDEALQAIKEALENASKEEDREYFVSQLRKFKKEQEIPGR
ncbi:MAG: M48 family metalloprotease [Desulfatiglandales bacterium]